MKKRKIVFHGTNSDYVKNILSEGLKPSGGHYGNGVYTAKSPYKALEKSKGNSIVFINPKGYEKYAFIPMKSNGREKDWVVFEKEISPQKIMGVVEIKDDKIEYVKRGGKREEIPYSSKAELKKILGKISREINDMIYNPVEYEKIRKKIVP